MTEMYLVFIGILIVGGLLGSAISQGKTNDLIENFRKLGVLKGRTLEEIVAVVGEPKHWSTMSNGQYLYQWYTNASPAASSYHICLIFTGNICEGITSEHVHKP
jgi:archaellum component FlaG (FlaF/FlaG flagellin family)